MTPADIERDIRKFLVDNFLFGRAEKLRDDQSLLGTVIDSTGALELVTFLQEHFAIEVRDEDMTPENHDSVKSVVAYVARKLAEKTKV
jgi:acyl carrier protein